MSVWYTCQQPSLFPPIYLVARLAQVHHWVVFGEAQFDRFHVQSKLGDKANDVPLTVPLAKPYRLMPFEKVRLHDPQTWVDTLAARVDQIYRKSPVLEERRAGWLELLARIRETDSLVAVCVATMRWVNSAAHLDTQIHDSRSLVPDRPADPAEWVESFAEPLSATDYVQGQKSIESYFKTGLFSGVNVWAQDFSTQYSGVGGKKRDASYSVLDLMMTSTDEEVRRVLMVGAKGRRPGDRRMIDDGKEWRADARVRPSL